VGRLAVRDLWRDDFSSEVDQGSSRQNTDSCTLGGAERRKSVRAVSNMKVSGRNRSEGRIVVARDQKNSISN